MQKAKKQVNRGICYYDDEIKADLLENKRLVNDLTQAIEIETYNMTEQLDNVEEYDNEERYESYDDAILEASDEEWELCDC